MIEVIPGNLLEAKEKIIGHQTNCKGIMGSKEDKKKTTNVASQLRQKYGDKLFKPYKTLCDENHDLLGTVQALEMSDGKIICNMFAQDNYGYAEKQYTSLESFRKCCESLRTFATTKGIWSVAMPYKIGSNRGGASWTDVYSILKEVFKEGKVKLVLYMKE